MAALPYDYYVDIVTKRYFHGVDNYEMDRVLAVSYTHLTLPTITE